MIISKVQAHYRNNNFFRLDNNNKCIKTNISSPNDTFAFTGRRLSSEDIEKIDNYILNLKAIKGIREKAAKKIEAAKKMLAEDMQKINEQISPFLDNEDFLWAIQTKENKTKFSRFVVDNAYFEGLGYSKELNDKSWKKVFDSIRNTILSSNPNKLEFDEIDALPNHKHQIMFQQLKDIVAQKAAVQAEHESYISIINHETFNLMMPYSSKNCEINIDFMNNTPNYSVEDFNKLIAKRAIEKESQLKKVRDKAYKYFFKGFRDYTHLTEGQFRQRSAQFADQEVISHLEGTTNAERPF